MSEPTIKTTLTIGPSARLYRFRQTASHGEMAYIEDQRTLVLADASQLSHGTFVTSGSGNDGRLVVTLTDPPSGLGYPTLSSVEVSAGDQITLDDDIYGTSVDVFSVSGYQISTMTTYTSASTGRWYQDCRIVSVLSESLIPIQLGGGNQVLTGLYSGKTVEINPSTDIVLTFDVDQWKPFNRMSIVNRSTNHITVSSTGGSILNEDNATKIVKQHSITTLWFDGTNVTLFGTGLSA